MGYRDEKFAQDNLRKRLRIIAVTVLCVLVAAACILSAFVPAESWKYYFDLPKLSQREDGELRVHFIDVENGNCALLELPDGKNVLVGGGADDGGARRNAFRLLNALKIRTIDALIVPNATVNGIGILRELVRFYDVKNVYLPMSAGSNAEYSAFVADVNRKGIPAKTAENGLIFGGEGSYELRVLLPISDGSSVKDTLLSLSYKGVDFLLGDGYAQDGLNALITEKRVGLWEKWGVVLDDFEILQTSERIGAELLSAFAVKFGCEVAVFSCRGGDGYTPSEEALTAMDSVGVNLCRTDVSGTLSFSVRSHYEYSISAEK